MILNQENVNIAEIMVKKGEYGLKINYQICLILEEYAHNMEIFQFIENKLNGLHQQKIFNNYTKFAESYRR